MRNARNRKGQALMEMMVGSMILVPIALFMLDMCFALFCTQIVDHLAKTSARVAASQPKQDLAEKQIQSCLNQFKTSVLIPSVKIDTVNYVADERVTVKVKLQAKLPVDFLMINNNPVFQAQAVEAIVVKSRS